MSIKLITGEPGAGKSLYCAREVIEHYIVKTRLPIVGNFPWRLDPWMLGNKPQMGLRSYLDVKYDDTFDIDRRLRTLDDAGCAEFYSHRGSGIDVTVERDNKGNPIDLDWEMMSESGPVVYVLDEFWKFAGARDWASTGKALFVYGKQHRKVGDEVFLLSHHHKDIDAAIQRIIEETIAMKNHSRMRIGFFRQPNIFTASHFQRVPVGNVSPMCIERFTLDAAGIAQTYDTSSGTGNLKGGVAADTKAKRKGVPFWALILFVSLIALAATQLPKLIGYGVSRAARTGEGVASRLGKVSIHSNALPYVNMTGGPPPEVKSEVPVLRSVPRPGGFVPMPEKVPPMEDSEKVFITGMSAAPGGMLQIWLSDGSKYRADDYDVRLISREFVVIGNTVYRWKKQAAELMDRAQSVMRQPEASAVVVEAPDEWQRYTTLKRFAK